MFAKEGAYRRGRSRALQNLGLVHKQDDNPVVDAFVSALPNAGPERKGKQVSQVLNRMGGFGDPVTFTNSNLPANV